MQRYIFSPTPPSISQILSYILPLMINFILPQIPDYFHVYYTSTHLQATVVWATENL